MSKVSKVRATLDYLRARQAYRDAGGDVAYTTDPAWLVTMAINRRAGWPDDPSGTRGSAIPVNGRYPKRAEGNCGEYLDSERLAWRINGTRIVTSARDCPPRYRDRLRHRLTWPGEEG